MAAIATSVQSRRHAVGHALAGGVGPRTSSANTTPPTAMAWPERPRPRRMTSTNAVMSSDEHDRERQVHRCADRGRHQEPLRFAEGRHQDHDVDEVTGAECVDHARGGSPGLDAILDDPPEEDRGRADRRDAGDSAEPQRPGRAAVAAPSHGDAQEHGDVHDVVAPEVEHRAPAGVLKLQPRELAVAAVEDRVSQEEQSTGELPPRRLANTSITPNMMTVISGAVGLLGATFFLSPAPRWQLTGARSVAT